MNPLPTTSNLVHLRLIFEVDRPFSNHQMHFSLRRSSSSLSSDVSRDSNASTASYDRSNHTDGSVGSAPSSRCSSLDSSTSLHSSTNAGTVSLASGKERLNDDSVAELQRKLQERRRNIKRILEERANQEPLVEKSNERAMEALVLAPLDRSKCESSWRRMDHCQNVWS